MNEIDRPTRLAPPPSDTEFASAQPAPPSQPPAVRAPIEPSAMQLPSHAVPFAPPNAPFGKVVEAIAGVMAEIKPVEKLGWNKFHQYAHARIGDLNAELTPLMGKHGIVVIQNEVRRDMFDNGAVVSIQYEFTILHKSGEVYPERPVISGMARCRTQKESFDDKTFNKCHTAARKYFLIGLFQIPVSDEDDADADHGNDGTQQQRPRPTRRPPNPDGKPTPNVVPLVDQEHPTNWIERFKKACATSETPADVNKWYQANVAIFEKMKRFKDDEIDGLKLFEEVIAFMDELELKLQQPAEPKKDDQISSGPPARASRQRRQAPPPPEPEDATDATDEVKLWLDSLENAFGACESLETLMEAQQKYMVPRKNDFSQEAWNEASAKSRVHLKRIEEATKS